VIVGVILARAGSKRLPGKNKKLIAGRPMVVWSILEAQRSRYIDEIIVSSDDHDVLELANEHGAVALLRPPYLSTDTATSYAALEHAIGNLQGSVVLLQPTSPLRISQDIDHCFNTHQTMSVPAATAEVGKTVPNGAVYCGTTQWLEDGGNWDTQDTKLVPMPAARSVDIDTLEDFEKAQLIFEENRV